ncbi:MAG: fatty acid desaturase [Candidatus Caenarcaniphilales bacterium]|nr:fatty acid desaturase [Candidatus Caenarcaniphilales bacterium]
MKVTLENPVTHSENYPQDLKLTDLRKMVKAEHLNPPSPANLIGFIIKLALFAGSFYFSLISPWWITVLMLPLNGFLLFGLGTIGHDCGHGAYLRPRWLNELVGQICIVLHGMPYMGWKHSHNTHHANTNRVELDPDRLWLYKDEYLAMPPLGRAVWRLFHRQAFWASAVGHYFRSILPWAFRIREKTDRPEDIRAAYIDIAIFFASWIALHSALFPLFGFKSLIVHFLSIIFGFIALSVYVRTQHNNLAVGIDVHDKPWLTSRTVLQHPILDFFATNLNYHVEHHVLQTIPHANLPKVRKLIKPVILNHGQPYHESPIGSYLATCFLAEFKVLERDTLHEIPAKLIEHEKVA